jgi:hypothetical protein
MLTRLKNWIQGSRQRKLERWEAEQANLSKQDKQVIDQYSPGQEQPLYPTGSFDESRRGRS